MIFSSISWNCSPLMLAPPTPDRHQVIFIYLEVNYLIQDNSSSRLSFSNLMLGVELFYVSKMDSTTLIKYASPSFNDLSNQRIYFSLMNLDFSFLSVNPFWLDYFSLLDQSSFIYKNLSLIYFSILLLK